MAATGTWNGGGGGDLSWNTAANWGGSLPDFDDGDSVVDDIVFSTLNSSGDATTLDGNKTINSLTFSTSNGIDYSINGDTLTIKSGMITRDLSAAASVQTINSDVVLGTNGLIYVDGTHNTDSQLHINGSISDGGNGYGLTRNGARRLYLNGNNTYTGPTVVSAASTSVTFLNGSSQTSSLVVNNGLVIVANDYTSASSITLGGSVRINDPADVDSAADFIFDGGYIAATNFKANVTFNNPITMTGNMGFQGTDNITLTSNIALDGDRVIDVDTSRSDITQVLSGVISDGAGGPHSITLTSGRPLRINGDNTFSGGVIHQGPQLYLGHNNALGTGTLTINSNGADIYPNNGVVIANQIVINTNFTAGPYFHQTGDVMLATNSTITYTGATGSTLMLMGDIGETGGSRSLTTGSFSNRDILLAGDNTFSGGFTINGSGSPLYVGSDTALGTGTLTIDSTGGQPIRAQPGSGPITLTNPLDTGTHNIVIGDDDSDPLNFHATSWSGTGNINVAAGSSVGGTGTIAVNVVGGGSLIKDDPGVLEVTGNNTYAGGTTITTGTLLANGGVSALGTSTVAVSGGTLGGSGLIDAPVNVYAGGTIAPGNSTGILTVADNLLLDTGSTYVAEVNGGLAGSQYDALSASGNITINNAALSIILGYVPNPTDKIFLVINSGANPINGTFNALPDGTIIELGEYSGVPVKATIGYFGDSDISATTGGNDIVLYNFSIPEPGSLVLVMLSGLTIFKRRRAATA